MHCASPWATLARPAHTPRHPHRAGTPAGHLLALVLIASSVVACSPGAPQRIVSPSDTPSVTIMSLTEAWTNGLVDRSAVAGNITVAVRWDSDAPVDLWLFLDRCHVMAGGEPEGRNETFEMLNTAYFDSLSGQAYYPNGPHVLYAQIRAHQTGQILASSQEIDLTFANRDTMILSAEGKGATADSTGATWQTGDLTATVVPVFYTGPTADSARFTLRAKTADGAVVTITGVDHLAHTFLPATDGLSFTFPDSVTPAHGGTRGIRDAAATVSAIVFTPNEVGPARCDFAGALRRPAATTTQTTAPFAYDAGG